MNRKTRPTEAGRVNWRGLPEGGQGAALTGLFTAIRVADGQRGVHGSGGSSRSDFGANGCNHTCRQIGFLEQYADVVARATFSFCDLAGCLAGLQATHPGLKFFETAHGAASVGPPALVGRANAQHRAGVAQADEIDVQPFGDAGEVQPLLDQRANLCLAGGGVLTWLHGDSDERLELLEQHQDGNAHHKAGHKSHHAEDDDRHGFAEQALHAASCTGVAGASLRRFKAGQITCQSCGRKSQRITAPRVAFSISEQ